MSIIEVKKGILALEDGTYFKGNVFGADGETFGEIVFNTGLTGYQEIITDPSYTGQIVTLTYPQIGNYGINEEDKESQFPRVSGLITRELSPQVSNFRATGSLEDYLKKFNIIGLSEVETRALVLHIREKGAMRSVLSTIDFNIERLVEKARSSHGLVGRDLVKEISTKVLFTSHATVPKKYSIVAFDFGIKWNIVRSLNHAACDVHVVPASTSAEAVLSMNPDGIFLSNGPGDPEPVSYAIRTIKKLIGKKPIFGICLGHQLLGLALGGRSFKLKYGHRGSNHPVKDLSTGKVEITSQNHGFCIDPESLDLKKIEITHINLNDNTLEGFRHKGFPLFCVQYHPEASPGPHDSHYLFKRFTTMIDTFQSIEKQRSSPTPRPNYQTEGTTYAPTP